MFTTATAASFNQYHPSVTTYSILLKGKAWWERAEDKEKGRKWPLLASSLTE